MDDARPVSDRIVNLPSAYYSAGLLGVAAFLLLFMLFPEPILQYTAHLELEQEILGDADPAASASLISQTSVEQLAQQHLADATAVLNFRAEVVPVSNFKSQVRLELASRHASESLDLTQSVADRIIAAQPTTVVPREAEQRALREDVLRRLALTKDAERAADEEITKLEREHLSQSLSHMREMAQASQAGSNELPELSDLGLAWQAARGRLADLESRREKLLVTRTEAHPLVQEINYQIQTQIETMAKLPPEESTTENAPAAANAQAFANIQRAMQAYQSRLAECTAQRESIRARKETLETELQRLSQPLPSYQLRTAISSPAAIVERDGGRPSALRLSAMLLGSAAVGFITFMLAQQINKTQPVATVQQVQAELGLPVVTIMKTKRPHFQSKPHQAETEWLRSAVFSAELLVLILAMAFAVAYSSVNHISQPATEDPLGVVAETLDRLGEDTVRR